MEKIYNIYFSPNNSTKKISNRVSKKISKELKKELIQIDLLNKNRPDIKIANNSLIIISMPVYSGRIPEYARNILEDMNFNNNPCIPIVVYGNRDYDDALLEISDICLKKGSPVIAAASFIAQHSIFLDMAKNRPDSKDYKIIDDFSNRCIDKIKSKDISYNNLDIKGNIPYRDIASIPLKPRGDRKCISCNKCVDICPKNAISKDSPKDTDSDLCISCGACIRICPEDSRGYKGILYRIANWKFKRDNSERKEPEIFI